MLNKMCNDKGKYDNKRPHNPGCGIKIRICKRKVVVEKSNKSDETGSCKDKDKMEKNNREHCEVVKFDNQALYQLTNCTDIYQIVSNGKKFKIVKVTHHLLGDLPVPVWENDTRTQKKTC